MTPTPLHTEEYNNHTIEIYPDHDCPNPIEDFLFCGMDDAAIIGRDARDFETMSHAEGLTGKEALKNILGAFECYHWGGKKTVAFLESGYNGYTLLDVLHQSDVFDKEDYKFKRNVDGFDVALVGEYGVEAYYHKRNDLWFEVDCCEEAPTITMAEDAKTRAQENIIAACSTQGADYIGYIGKRDINNEWREHKGAAMKYLKGAMETYTQWLAGECYGYIVKDKDGGEVDACWGFICHIDHVIDEAKINV